MDETPPDQRFPKPRRLRTAQDFARVRRLSRTKAGRSAAGPLMVVSLAPQEPTLVTGSRVGFTVSRKVGNAVTRNLVRRRLREHVRRWLPHIVPGWDILITARVAAAVASHAALGEELATHLRRLGARPATDEQSERD